MLQINNKIILSVILVSSFISTADAIKCFVCGHGSDVPFADANFNQTFIKQKIHKSCDEFDRIPLEEKYKYEMECPEGHSGCMLNVGGEFVRSQ